MYPGKIFGFGFEAPLLRRNVRYTESNGKLFNLGYLKIGDIRLVAKYQFGIYRKYNLFGRERLLNMLVSLVGKLKLPNAATNIKGPDGLTLTPSLQPGSGATDLTLGFIFHTDTQKYFRIHGHFTTTFSLAHRAFSPGEKIHFTLSYIFARLGIRDRYYPFLGLKGWWKAKDRLNNTPLSHSEGLHLYLSPGIRSIWWYFADHRMFCMLQTAFQIKLIETGGVMAGPTFGIYFGTRIFFR